ncbi:MAG: hypothetical protein KC417_00460 [Myxococcales bacterium]|nr:hypothetical protein [Myxococcales bacterium]
MTNHRLNLVALSLLAALVAPVAAPRIARADGAVLKPADLDAKTRGALAANIAEARATHPEHFTAVAAVDTYRPEGIGKVRHARPTATRGFRQLGPAALYPLLEIVAFEAERGALTEEQWTPLGTGALEALAFLRDPRAEAVLIAAYAKAPKTAWVEHAAEGVGMLCSAEGSLTLLSHLTPGDDRFGASVTGLQHCRTTEVADRIAEVLRTAPSEDIAVRASRALGYLGSSWALAVDKRVSAADAATIRGTAGRALIGAVVERPGAVRERAIKALMMLEDPAHSAELRRIAAGSNGTLGPALTNAATLLETSHASNATAQARARTR